MPKTTETNAAARLLGRRGGLKGGRARARKLSAARLSQIGRKGGRARARKARRDQTGRFASVERASSLNGPDSSS